jgi:hypothetical protein
MKPIEPLASPWKSHEPLSVLRLEPLSVLFWSDMNDRSDDIRYCSSDICSLR